jgi:TatA/E family protein of Tat protein translocase
VFGLGVGEIAVILVIALVFIGPKKLPELARTLGKGFREFQGAMKGINQTIQNPTAEFSRETPPAESKSQTKSQVPWEEQYKDDPPHDQNLAEEDIALQKSEAESSAKTSDDTSQEKKPT